MSRAADASRLNVLIRHVHGSWLSAFVMGRHTYLLPVEPHGTAGRRRAEWPASVIELEPGARAEPPIDVAIVQGPGELADLERWTLGRRVPIIYLEHNAPQGRIAEMRHPLADRDDIVIVHVTHFNALFWDTGSTPTVVIEHGIPDPGYGFIGDLARAAVTINEPVRRGRVTGTDLLPRFERIVPLDIFGIATGRDLPHAELHREMARRRVYLHPYRWTSLGLSLIEAMLIGMPIVALATTEAARAVPSGVGVCSNDLREIDDALAWLANDLDAATTLGRAARQHALAAYPLETFLRAWDVLMRDVVERVV